MSFAEDMEYDIYEQEDFYNPLDYISKKDTIWEDKDGNHYKFEDMDDFYLQNVYNFLKRKKKIIPDKLTEELKKIKKGVSDDKRRSKRLIYKKYI